MPCGNHAHPWVLYQPFRICVCETRCNYCQADLSSPLSLVHHVYLTHMNQQNEKYALFKSLFHLHMKSKDVIRAQCIAEPCLCAMDTSSTGDGDSEMTSCGSSTGAIHYHAQNPATGPYGQLQRECRVPTAQTNISQNGQHDPEVDTQTRIWSDSIVSESIPEGDIRKIKGPMKAHNVTRFYPIGTAPPVSPDDEEMTGMSRPSEMQSYANSPNTTGTVPPIPSIQAQHMSNAPALVPAGPPDRLMPLPFPFKFTQEPPADPSSTSQKRKHPQDDNDGTRPGYEHLGVKRRAG